VTTKKPTATPTKHAAAYGAFVDIFVALFVMGIGLALWYAGAYFTITALIRLGVPLDTLDGFEWLIPLGVSLLELRYWPSVKQTQMKTLALLLVGGFDLLSTTYGVFLWFPGRVIPLGMGYTIPKSGIALLIPVFVVSLILTFGPERIVVWAGKEIRRMWGGAA
jgi:hypothetical protein